MASRMSTSWPWIFRSSRIVRGSRASSVVWISESVERSSVRSSAREIGSRCSNSESRLRLSGWEPTPEMIHWRAFPQRCRMRLPILFESLLARHQIWSSVNFSRQLQTSSSVGSGRCLCFAFRPAGRATSSGLARDIGCPGGAPGLRILSNTGRAC